LEDIVTCPCLFTAVREGVQDYGTPLPQKELPLSCTVSCQHEELLWFGPGRQQRPTWSLYHPFPPWAGEENGKEKAKLMGWDKDWLTEQQRKQTVVTTIMLIREFTKTREYTVQSSHCLMPSAPPAAIHLPPSSSPTPNPA